MKFNSLHFALFFPAFLLLIKHCPSRYHRLLALAASYYFYMTWKADYGVLLLLTTLCDFWLAHKIEGAPTLTSKRCFLALSLISNLGVLFHFKYLHFFFPLAPFSSWELPLGISFYTFQSMAYIFDVYRGDLRAEKKFLDFALFISFWPQLVAGPIERASALQPQLKRPMKVHFSQSGSMLLAMGFFKKMVIADRLAHYVDATYSNSQEVPALALLLATYFFAIQIYCDFSGYSDIARGCARFFGVELMENFRNPYAASSVSEFWRRWHISLSSWFAQYVYRPLGGNRVSAFKLCQNLLCVFLLSGLWHGANWTFLIWGGLHGFMVITEKLTGWDHRHSGPTATALRKVLTFHLVTFAWLFFRAPSVNETIFIIKKIFLQLSFHRLAWQKSILPFTSEQTALDAGIAIAILLSVWLLFENRKEKLRPWALTALIACIFIFGEWGQNSFIYFQF